MKKIVFAFISFLVIASFACKKSDPSAKSPEEYFVFGHFYGECGGPGCVIMFKIENGILYEDTLDQYPIGIGLGQTSFIAYPQDKYEIAKVLIDAFPAELALTPNTTLGIPDGGDWGGLYIERKIGGTVQYWYLDLNLDNMPVQYHAYVEKVRDVISQM